MASPLMIRASAVGAVLGLSKFQSPLTLYHRMRGEIPEQEDNELLKEGRYFEDAIGRIAADKYGFEIQLDAPLSMTDGDILSGHPDRFFVMEGKIGVLEIKQTRYGEIGHGGWGDPGTDQVPEDYWFQTQTYSDLALRNTDLFGYPVADFGLLAAHMNSGTELYKIPHDPQVMVKVREECRAFVKRVLDGDAPDPQDEADARNRWAVRERNPIGCDAGMLEQLRQLVRLKEQEKALRSQISEMQTAILCFAQDHDAIVYHDENGAERTVATLGVNRKFDANQCLAEHPDLLNNYATLDTSKLRKDNRKMYDAYSRKPQNAVDQTRVLRVKEKML